MDTYPPHRQRQGLLLAIIGVAGFSATLPATRLAVAYIDPVIVGLGRSLIAALLALILLLAFRQSLPSRSQWQRLLIVTFGVVIGFPLLMTLAMRDLPTSHGAIIVALAPLFTAIASAVRTGQRPSSGFWLCSVAGSVVVLIFLFNEGGIGLQWADGILLLGCLLVAIGVG